MRMSFKSAATATALITHNILRVHIDKNPLRLIFRRNQYQNYSSFAFAFHPTAPTAPSITRINTPSKAFISTATSTSSSTSAFVSQHFAKHITNTQIQRHSRLYEYSSSSLHNKSNSNSDNNQEQDQTTRTTKTQDNFQMHHFDSLGSTQDEARKILLDPTIHESNQYHAITASSQIKGRGTNGRTWIGKKGNTFLTIAVPSNEFQILLTLLPLHIGTILAQRIHELIDTTTTTTTTNGTISSSSSSSSKGQVDASVEVKVKWPNDVLVNQKKIAGVLIESDQDHKGNHYFLIGIGVNYKFAPIVETTGSQRGREATCICDYITSTVPQHADDDDDDDDGDNTVVVQQAKELGERIAKDVIDWIQFQKTFSGAAESVIAQWERWADFGSKMILRDAPGNEVVVPMSLEKDGQLRVMGQDGKERLLCVDYLL